MDKKIMMEELVREAHEKGVFTGTWLLAEDGDIVAKGAVGFRDAEDRLPMREDSIFDIGSVSKQFTAAAVMLLRREGKLGLEDEITKFFPQIPYAGITIRHLLTHTSGLPDHLAWVVDTAKKENAIPGNDAVLRYLTECGEEPHFAPGEQWEYCNAGYSLLAMLVEKLSGMAFPDYLKKNIFDPAGMVSTSLCHRIRNGLAIEDLACGLVFDNGVLTPAERSFWKDLVVSFDGSEGAGCVKSNIFDLLAWDRALREEKILTKEEQDLMYTPVRLLNGETGGGGYGFGLGIFDQPGVGKFVWHEGEWPGYLSWYGHFLDTDRVLVILCSRTGVDGRYISGFFNAMLTIALGYEPQPLQFTEEMAAADPDKSRWESFCGEYETSSDGLIIEKVYIKDGDLFALIYSTEADSRFEARLYPFGEDTFGIREDTEEIVFGDGFLTFGGEPCRKL